jgi:trans-aconitate methyltransferase
MRTPFDGATCTAPAARVARTRDLVIEYAPSDRAIAVLDVGCGTGALALQLASALPRASVTGVDISSANVAAADAARRRMDTAVASRVQFECGDYLEMAVPAADVIATDTVLHFIAGRDVLWRKLAADLRAGGVLICCMASDGAHNRALGAMRRVLRAVRSRPVDALLLAVARRAYGRQMNDALLRERIAYMYIPPEQFMSASVRDRIAPGVGLRAIAEREVDAASATELKQRVTVFRKE